jgi:hypothetical protein
VLPPSSLFLFLFVAFLDITLCVLITRILTRSPKRHGKSTDRHRRRQLLALRGVWRVPPNYIAFPTAVVRRDGARGVNGRTGECGSCESRYVFVYIPTLFTSLSLSLTFLFSITFCVSYLLVTVKIACFNASLRCGRTVEMFKVRMQGQYGASTDKRLRVVMGEMWSQWGFRRGIMRGYWVSLFPVVSLWPPPVVYPFNNRRFA